ncbi:MAG: UTP--glucose-1-phosphate uridylyltransferase, partial [Candidatus Helarchaeota archaeon]
LGSWKYPIILNRGNKKVIKKAVIPAAGLGTRLLPATYAQPKEMLPCGRKPTIQYVVEELAAAGVKDILIITGRAKRALEDHFDQDFSLFERLKNSGKTALHKEMQFIEKLGVNFYFTRQANPTGLADAIYLAKDFVGTDSFYVALGDTIILSDPLGLFLKDLAKLHLQKGVSGTIGLEKVRKEDIQKYGIIKGTYLGERIWHIEYLIEKPSPDIAPSQLAICGRYVFTPEIFSAIEKTPIGIGNERQLTDSIKILIKEGADILGLEMSDAGRRYDIGNPITYAIAYIELSLEDPEIGDFLKLYLKKLVGKF